MTKRRRLLVLMLALAIPIVGISAVPSSAHSCQGRESGGKPHKVHKRNNPPDHKCNDEIPTTTTRRPHPQQPPKPPRTTTTTVSPIPPTTTPPAPTTTTTTTVVPPDDDDLPPIAPPPIPVVDVPEYAG